MRTVEMRERDGASAASSSSRPPPRSNSDPAAASSFPSSPVIVSEPVPHSRLAPSTWLSALRPRGAAGNGNGVAAAGHYHVEDYDVDADDPDHDGGGGYHHAAHPHASSSSGGGASYRPLPTSPSLAPTSYDSGLLSPPSRDSSPPTPSVSSLLRRPSAPGWLGAGSSSSAAASHYASPSSPGLHSPHGSPHSPSFGGSWSAHPPPSSPLRPPSPRRRSSYCRGASPLRSMLKRCFSGGSSSSSTSSSGGGGGGYGNGRHAASARWSGASPWDAAPFAPVVMVRGRKRRLACLSLWALLATLLSLWSVVSYVQWQHPNAWHGPTCTPPSDWPSSKLPIHRPRVHVVVPMSRSSPHLCRSLASMVVHEYNPTVVNWGGNHSHAAKIYHTHDFLTRHSTMSQYASMAMDAAVSYQRNASRAQLRGQLGDVAVSPAKPNAVVRWLTNNGGGAALAVPRRVAASLERQRLRRIAEAEERCRLASGGGGIGDWIDSRERNRDAAGPASPADDIVVSMDAYDVWAQQPLDALVDRFRRSGKRIVFAADHGCGRDWRRCGMLPDEVKDRKKRLERERQFEQWLKERQRHEAQQRQQQLQQQQQQQQQHLREQEEQRHRHEQEQKQAAAAAAANKHAQGVWGIGGLHAIHHNKRADDDDDGYDPVTTRVPDAVPRISSGFVIGYASDMLRLYTDAVRRMRDVEAEMWRTPPAKRVPPTDANVFQHLYDSGNHSISLDVDSELVQTWLFAERDMELARDEAARPQSYFASRLLLRGHETPYLLRNRRTGNVPALLHFPYDKRAMEAEWESMWWAGAAGEEVRERVNDFVWQRGGAMTINGAWLAWEELCGWGGLETWPLGRPGELRAAAAAAAAGEAATEAAARGAGEHQKHQKHQQQQPQPPQQPPRHPQPQERQPHAPDAAAAVAASPSSRVDEPSADQPAEPRVAAGLDAVAHAQPATTPERGLVPRPVPLRLARRQLPGRNVLSEGA